MHTVDEGSVQVAADEGGLQSAGAGLHSHKVLIFRYLGYLDSLPGKLYPTICWAKGISNCKASYDRHMHSSPEFGPRDRQ